MSEHVYIRRPGEELDREALDGAALHMEISRELPENYTFLEYDVLAVAKRLDRIPFPLRDLVDPATCPVEVLPYLAWQYSIDLWDDTWSAETKRSIIQRWAYLHRLKGTETGIREHVRYAGGTVEKIVAPPVATYAGKSYTQAERDAWLAPMPQLRVYRFKTNGSGKGKSFYHSNVLGEKGRVFAGHLTPPASDAYTRIGSRAILYDPLDGSLTPVKTETIANGAVAQYQVAIKGKAGKGFFCGKLGHSGRIPGGVSQSGGLYTISMDEGYSYATSSLHLNTITPSLTPVDTRFEYIEEHGTGVSASLYPKKHGGSGSRVLHKRFLPPSTARERLYQRVYLFDPPRQTTLRKARCFANHMRLGIPAYTAEISILVTGKRPRNSFGDFVRGFLHKAPKDKLTASLRAVRIAKSARDKTLVQIGLNKIPQIGNGLPLDTDYRFGDRILGA